MWDNGTAFPEPCIDRIADTVGKVGLGFSHDFTVRLYAWKSIVFSDWQYEALGWLCGGLGFFATLGLLAVVNDKASKVPFVSDLYFNHCWIHHPFLLFDWACTELLGTLERMFLGTLCYMLKLKPLARGVSRTKIYELHFSLSSHWPRIIDVLYQRKAWSWWILVFPRILSFRVFFFFPIVVSECDSGVIEVEHRARAQKMMIFVFLSLFMTWIVAVVHRHIISLLVYLFVLPLVVLVHDYLLFCCCCRHHECIRMTTWELSLEESHRDTIKWSAHLNSKRVFFTAFFFKMFSFPAHNLVTKE